MTTIQPTPEQAQAFFGRDQDSPICMINLLKFKDKATYEADRAEAAENLTGREAYMRYGAAVGGLLADIGATPTFAGSINDMMIGEGDWDMVAIVEYPSRASMMQMGTSEAYQAIHYHRDAGLAHQLLIDTTKVG
ncbi:MAG: DUF1330 domain-containing protein [Hyphomonadaceae bacterium]